MAREPSQNQNNHHTYPNLTKRERGQRRLRTWERGREDQERERERESQRVDAGEGLGGGSIWSRRVFGFPGESESGEIEFLAFLEFLIFWDCWSSRAFGFGAAEFSGFLENPKIALSQWTQWGRLGWWVGLGSGCAVLCCIGRAQIGGGGAVLLWPRSVVELCCCESQINGSQTSLYLTLTLFLSLRLIWKFLA